MRSYEPVLRRIFGAIVPGHRLIVIPGPQPATGHTPAGFRVTFPVTDDLAEQFFGPLWSDLDAALRFQMVAYLAGHESMHGWEMAHGYQVVPTNTLRGMLANILADIRGDYLPILDRLNNWSTNREVAYRILCEPAGTPADAEPTEIPHADAIRLVGWALLYMRCGRLRLADHTAVDAPTHPIYQEIWPRITPIVIQARHCSWREEPELVEQLLELLWTWTREEHQRRGLHRSGDSPGEPTTSIVDTDLTTPDDATASGTTNPFYWQDPEPADHNGGNPADQEANGDPADTSDTTDTDDSTGSRDGAEVDADLDEAIAQLHAALADTHGATGCHAQVQGTDDADDNPTSQVQPETLEEIHSSGLYEIADGDLTEEIGKQEASQRAAEAAAIRSNPACVLHGSTLAAAELLPEQWQEDVSAEEIAAIRELCQLIAPLGTSLSTILRPLLEGPSRRRRATARGNQLDLGRQASRIHIQAEHSVEQEPPIWLDERARGHGKVELNVAIVVDCSGSMALGKPPLAAACHAAAAALLTAAHELSGLADTALAGFTESVLAIRGFGDPGPMDDSVNLLAQAQSTAGGTALEPAIAWALAQLDQVAHRRSCRRLLMVLTDADLTPWDAQVSAQRIAEADEDIACVAIGLGDVNAQVLRSVVPETVILQPERTTQLPTLVQQLVENVVRNNRLLM